MLGERIFEQVDHRVADRLGDDAAIAREDPDPHPGERLRRVLRVAVHGEGEIRGLELELAQLVGAGAVGQDPLGTELRELVQIMANEDAARSGCTLRLSPHSGAH